MLAAFAAVSPFAFAQDPAVAPAVAPAPAAEKKIEVSAEKKKAFLQAIGWQVAKSGQLDQLGFSGEEVTEILAGMRLAVEGKGDEIPAQMQKDMESFQAFIRPYVDRARAAMEKKQAEEMAKRAESGKKNIEAGLAAIAKLKAEDKAVVFEKVKGADGVEYEYGYKVIAAGDAANKATAADTVKAKYTGKLLDGTVFDSTEKHGGEPAEFPLNGVIPGWTHGMQKIGKGGKIQLWIPSGLAYGNQGAGDAIQPGSTLVFEVELVDVTKAAPAPTTEKK